jgi:ubiquinone/menaquinone biosynthesis C-methylase UbiE
MNAFARIMMNSRVHARSRIRLIDGMLESVSLPRDGVALELGCGAGFSSAHLASRYGMRVSGTDVDKGNVETAVRKNVGVENLHFLVSDATALPFDDASFDLVLAQNVFHHISDWRTAAREVARVIRPGGLFLFSDIIGPGTVTRSISRLEKDHGFHEKEALILLLKSHEFETVTNKEAEELRRREFTILLRKKR